VPDIANIVTVRAQIGKADLLGDALRKLIALTRKESGCAICELHQSSENAETWMVYERWTGDDAFASHMHQPYVADFLACVDDLVSEPPQVRPFQHRV
jgi:quinol monooxygenase YgiN